MQDHPAACQWLQLVLKLVLKLATAGQPSSFCSTSCHLCGQQQQQQQQQYQSKQVWELQLAFCYASTSCCAQVPLLVLVLLAAAACGHSTTTSCCQLLLRVGLCNAGLLLKTPLPFSCPTNPSPCCLGQLLLQHPSQQFHCLYWKYRVCLLLQVLLQQHSLLHHCHQ
jgi:hypothetical protein